MPNGLPSWDEWQGLGTKVQEFEKHRILVDLNNRMTAIESNKWKNGALVLGGSFMGGASTIGAALLARMMFWKGGGS